MVHMILHILEGLLVVAGMLDPAALTMEHLQLLDPNNAELETSAAGDR